MARILDTIPDFEAFARKAGLESPLAREALWKEVYYGSHPEVFEAFHEAQGGREGMHAVVRELSKVRMRVKDAQPVMPGLIEEIEPKVREAMGMDGAPAQNPSGAAKLVPPAGDSTDDSGGKSPLHVLMVGTFATNAFVGPLGDELAVFHCLEWFSGSEPTKVLIAHEDAHAWHQLLLGSPPPEDLAWMTFYEGLAIQISRSVVPDRPEDDYFWYGIAGFKDWLGECRADEAKIMEKFRKSMDHKDASEVFFGSGFVEKKWRTGYFIADKLVAGLGKSLEELTHMSIDEGRKAILDSL